MKTTPRQRRQARTEQAILDAALELIAERGLSNFSLRETARRVDYSPAGLYEYFGGKDEIVAALVAQGMERLGTYLARVPADLPPRQRLIEIGLAYLEFARLHTTHFLLMFTALPSQRMSLREPTSTASPYTVLLQSVQAAAAASDLDAPSPTDVEAVAYGLWSLVHGMAMLQQTHLRGFGADFAAYNRRTIEALLDGLLGQ